MALNFIATLENSNHIFGFWVKCSLEEGQACLGWHSVIVEKNAVLRLFGGKFLSVVLQHAAHRSKNWPVRVRHCLFDAGNGGQWLGSCLEESQGCLFWHYILCSPLATQVYLWGEKWNLFCFINEIRFRYKTCFLNWSFPYSEEMH